MYITGIHVYIYTHTCVCMYVCVYIYSTDFCLSFCGFCGGVLGVIGDMYSDIDTDIDIDIDIDKKKLSYKKLSHSVCPFLGACGGGYSTSVQKTQKHKNTFCREHIL